MIKLDKQGRGLLQGVAKVMEWHGKMDAVQLEELKQKRLNGKYHLNGNFPSLQLTLTVSMHIYIT